MKSPGLRRIWQRLKAADRAAPAESLSDERFRLAIESAPYGVVMVDRSGRINLVNRELERAFGYDSGELVGQRIEMLLPVDLREQHVLNRKTFAARPEARSMGVGRELRGRRKDGTEFPIEIGLNPLRSEAGDMVLATVVDITQRKAMETALRREEEQFRLVVESAPNGVVMVDAEGHIVLVNRALETAFGYPREELLGMSIENLIPHSLRERHSGYRRGYAGSADARAMGAGRDLRGLRKDGTEFPIEIGLNPLQTAEGHFVLATVVDITARKRAEEAHRSSQKMEALGTLAGGIAHDFNNILYAISGNVRLALEDLGLHHPAHPSLREIDKAGKRASELVRQILSFARQQESARKPTPLQPVIEEALQLLRSSLSAAISIRARYSSNLPMVLADSTQIHQIMMNLATNAAHALKGGAD
ncbi:MAG TPA: PAS domain S-box protein, partial [Burkholderiales bacterium]|nr:PAS domain S-box protein [Burkholderiales bacterium]